MKILPNIDLNKERVVGGYDIFVLQRIWGNLEYEDERVSTSVQK